MFCTKCGKEIASGNKFCIYCGAKIAENKNEFNDKHLNYTDKKPKTINGFQEAPPLE